MNKRENVYCCDCKHPKAYNAIGEHCCRKVRTTWDTPLEEEWWGYALKINRNNNCKMFEAKDEDKEENDDD